MSTSTKNFEEFTKGIGGNMKDKILKKIFSTAIIIIVIILIFLSSNFIYNIAIKYNIFEGYISISCIYIKNSISITINIMVISIYNQTGQCLKLS